MWLTSPLLHLLIDAMPATYLSLVAVGTEEFRRRNGSRLHWFIRTSIMIAVLIPLMLIPAYEVIVAGASQMALIAGGLAVWRSRKDRPTTAGDELAVVHQPFQISLRSLLLVTIPVAVAMAVVAQMSHLHWMQWIGSMGNGALSGMVTLAVVALVNYRVRLHLRFLLAIALCIGAAVVTAFAHAFSSATQFGTSISRQSLGNLLQPRMTQWIVEASFYYAGVLAIAVTILCIWIALMRRAGWWQTPAGAAASAAKPVTHHQLLARAALVAVLLATVALPFTMLVKLLSPTPLPEPVTVVPSNFSHLYAASQELEPLVEQVLQSRQQFSTQQVLDKLPGNLSAFQEMRKAFSSTVDPNSTLEADVKALEPLHNAILARYAVGRDLQLPEILTESSIDLVQFDAMTSSLYLSHPGYRPHRVRRPQVWEASRSASELRRLRLALSRQQRQELLETFSSIEANLEPWDAFHQRLRQTEESESWQSHLHVILDDWKGVNRYAEQHKAFHVGLTQLRMFLVELAIFEYQEDHGHLPENLEALVPLHLPRILDDPYGSGPLRYRANEDSYLLYSVGPNGIDNGGQPSAPDQEDGDLLVDEVFQQP